MRGKHSIFPSLPPPLLSLLHYNRKILLPSTNYMNLTIAVYLRWLFAAVTLFQLITLTSAVVFEGEKEPPQMLPLPLLLHAQQQQQAQSMSPSEQKYAKFYDYQCFNENNDDLLTNFDLNQVPVGLEVSDHVIHQILTRIFGIFLREKLNYRNVSLVPLKHFGNINSEDYEFEKSRDIMALVKNHPDLPDMNMINLAIWLSPIAHAVIPQTVYEAGSSIQPGRFGWFVPETQIASAGNTVDSLHYNVFQNRSNIHYKQYIIDEEIMQELRADGDATEFISPNCRHIKCVTLLAEFRTETSFVENHIKESGSFLNVLWLGQKFRAKVLELHRRYQHNETYRNKRFIVLHFTPSDIINAEIKFKTITLPRCEDLLSLQASLCKYELTPLLKYYSKSLVSEGNDRLLYALRRFIIEDSELLQLQQLLIQERRYSENNDRSAEDIYNAVACNFLKDNVAIYKNWISKMPKITLSIGGIFPITETNRGHQNLVRAVTRAVNAINRNTTILANYELAMLTNDGRCKADVVMKAFIHYFNVPKVLGVLGPACSETVEPIAGIAKHTNMAVISYSAEGALFADRREYPFFFRTIGSNRQYEDVYIQLMKVLGWRRVAALTEDGQKYTEYISHMEATMKQRNLELIINKKFLSDVTSADMNKYLLDLKQRHAKIIIADIHNRYAELALCEAFKLGMTGREGYVWFLPSWLSKDWSTRKNRSGISCSSEELQMAFEGHFSIMHTPFGKPGSHMPENISIQEWLQNYDTGNESISNYTGFAYDAVWAYALAADKLLRENRDAVNHLRDNDVVKRFVELIWQTDFAGLSGRIRFGQGGSRITDVDILQWRKRKFHEVGKFYPALQGSEDKLQTNGGKLELKEQDIEWLSGSEPPGDGTYDCNFSGLAELLGTDCDSAAVAFTAVLCLMAVVIVSLVSFLFWKRRYDSKLKQSAKIMKNFGIDLLSPSRNKCNTLDKWEIPKENVVVNRRLGEGAFGTVYGGEAQLGAEGWTAVAVKTLKAGASTEDRLDFLSEAEAMKRFDHKNVVKLLGVCLQSEPIYTIMEFMLYGDLKTYLLARRHMVNDKISDDSDISSKRLTMYAMDVARGLAYLAQQKYVHRDIACRNCLVNAQRVVKLGDFGMARPTYESDYYRFNRKGMLPVRWMAPESLALGMFTPSSDVWAFGVVVYEIITFGSFPYQGLTNNQALEYIKSGKTLQIPNGVKPHLEGLIKACWSQEVKKRPTATEIVDYISNCPRLLTPCLDFPGASVEMPETESDELELLPKARKCSPIKKDSKLDLLAETPENNFERIDRNVELFIEDMEMSEHTSIDMPTTDTLHIPPNNNEGDVFAAITPDGYSIMSPLLMHQVSESSDSSQGQLLKKSNSPESQQ